MDETKYPDITAKLEGEDGNIFNLLGIAKKAMRRAKVSDEEIRSFSKEVAGSDSYDQALQVIMKWVNVE